MRTFWATYHLNASTPTAACGLSLPIHLFLAPATKNFRTDSKNGLFLSLAGDGSANNRRAKGSHASPKKASPCQSARSRSGADAQWQARRAHASSGVLAFAVARVTLDGSLRGGGSWSIQSSGRARRAKTERISGRRRASWSTQSQKSSKASRATTCWGPEPCGVRFWRLCGGQTIYCKTLSSSTSSPRPILLTRTASLRYLAGSLKNQETHLARADPSLLPVIALHNRDARSSYRDSQSPVAIIPAEPETTGGIPAGSSR